MKGATHSPVEWVDGFLFVGNQPALDLLNTRLIKGEEPVELLPDTAALVRWLIAAEVLGSGGAQARVRGWGDSRALQAFLRELLVFREELRAAVVRVEAGEAPGHHFLSGLNQKLRTFPVRHEVHWEEGVMRRENVFEPTAPEDLWSAFADSAARLFTEVPAVRLRQCERCVVHFYDISKKGSRRWCSMTMCGNRSKVAAYQRRQRAVA